MFFNGNTLTASNAALFMSQIFYDVYKFQSIINTSLDKQREVIEKERQKRRQEMQRRVDKMLVHIKRKSIARKIKHEIYKTQEKRIINKALGL